jgi:hypothetical protein
MKKFIILNMCFYYCIISYSQVVKGKVFDSATNKVIISASIYFNGTFVGTTSDTEGNFELDISKNKNMLLTISAIGYYSVTLKHFEEGKTIEVKLSPKNYVMNEANVKAKSLKNRRKMCLKVFKEEFLGDDYKQMKCEIENENDITFNYDADYDTLKAYARNPIRILNKAMGYKITYFLNKFEYCWRNSGTLYEGNFIFQDMAAVDSAQKQSFYKTRFSVYEGSRMQFFKTIWTDSLNSPQFLINNRFGQTLCVKDVVKQVNGKKYLSYPVKIIVNFNMKISQLIFLNESVYFDKSGYFDGSGINWIGAMGIQRIADTLPHEYVAIDSEDE